MRIIILLYLCLAVSLIEGRKRGHSPSPKSITPSPKAPSPSKAPPSPSSKLINPPSKAPTQPAPAPPPGQAWILQSRLAHGVGNEFGSSISIHKDTLLVGAESEKLPGNNTVTGMVYVYRKTPDNKWRLIQKCSPGKKTQNFGRSVSLQPFSFAVGAPGVKTESVWIYTYKNKTYTPEQVINAPSSGIDFGSAVSLHEDTLAVSSLNGVYIYTQTKQKKRSKAPNNNKHRWNIQQVVLQGKPISSLKLQGTTLAVGRRAEGRVDIFNRIKDKKTKKLTWNMVQTIKPYSGSELDFFGESLSINNGSLIVGAPLATINNQSYAGAAFLYRRNPKNMTFTLEKKISAGKYAIKNGNFGASVALQDGIAVVGQPGTPGVADVFMWNGTDWERSSNRLFVRESVSFRNTAVSVSNKTVVVSGDTGDGGKSGVYVFVPLPKQKV